MTTNSLSTSIAHGITFAGGNYESPFTITSTGTVAPTGYGAIGVDDSVASGLTLINQGVINGGGGSNGFIMPAEPVAGGAGGAGVSLSGRGTFRNSGTITGGTGGVGVVGGAAGNGVDLSSNITLTNSGDIFGGSGPGAGGFGVYLNGGTLLNSGLIVGGQGAPAVEFGTNASTLIVDSGASFVGSVVANSTVSDVLAIGGSALVTVSNIGLEYQNFHTLAFESGAYGTFAGSLAALNDDSIIGAALGDGFYVNGFTASSTDATINANGTLAIAGNNNQTFDLIFTSAAINDVLDITTGTNGTGITIDPHTLNNSISTGITLTARGKYQSPFSITSQGTVAPTANGAIGVYGSAASGLVLINQGVIKSYGGEDFVGTGGTGGSGVELSGVESFSNSGTITGGGGGGGYTYGFSTTSGTRYHGGIGGAGGAGVGLSSTGIGLFSNSGTITGGAGGSGNGQRVDANNVYYAGTGATGGTGVALFGAGSFNNSSTIIGGAGGSGYYAGSGGAGVDFAGTDSFANTGTITGGNGGTGEQTGHGGNGVILSGSGSFKNEGTITGGNGGTYRYKLSGGGGDGVDITGTGWLTNYGHITGGNNGAGGAGGDVAGAGSLINFGTITGGNGGTGVDFTGTGSLTNNGAIDGGSSLVGGTGVDFTGTGSFTNNGAINGGDSTYYTIYGDGIAGVAGLDFSGSGIFSNIGSITGGQSADASERTGSGGVGVDFSGTGSFRNSGNITGASGASAEVGGAGGVGLDLTGTGSFSNSGTITGGNGDSSYIGGAGGVAVDFTGTGSFSNSGIIIGGNGGISQDHYFADIAAGAGVDLSGGGSFSNSGTITGGSAANGGAVGVIVSGGTLLNSGLIAGAHGADAVQFGNYASTLIVESGASFTGNVVANSTVSDVLAIGGTAPVALTNIGEEYQNFAALTFESGAVGTVSGTYTAMDALTITGFASGDTVDLTGFVATKDSFVSGVGLELTSASTTITLNINGIVGTTGPVTTSDFAFGSDGAGGTDVTIPCFVTNTRILTTRGYLPVQNLCVGDRAVTVRPGGPASAEIIWLGHFTVNCERLSAPETGWPILVSQGALGPGMPFADVWLSPDHCIVLDGVMIPVKELVNGRSIRRSPRATVTYWHVELTAHDVMLAEGLPVESYLDTGNRTAFTEDDVGTTQRRVHHWTETCLPIAFGREALEHLNAHLARHAEATLVASKKALNRFEISLQTQ